MTDQPNLYGLLNQFEVIGGPEMYGPNGLAMLIALWRKSNKLNWSDTFLMTNTELTVQTGIKSRETLNQCRNKLTQSGFFRYTPPKKGGSRGQYELCFDLYNLFETDKKQRVDNKVVQNTDNYTDKSLDKSPDNLPDNSLDTVLNKTKLNQIKELQQQPCAMEYSAYQLYQNNIRPIPSQPEHSQLIEWITRLGDSFVYKAIEECCKSAKDRPTFRFLEYLINAWIANGARAPEDIERLQAQYRNEKEKKGGGVKRAKSRESNGIPYDEFDEFSL